MEYVVPELLAFESLESKDSRRFAGKQVDLSTVLAQTRAFVIGDPGYGKTRGDKFLTSYMKGTRARHAVFVLLHVRDEARLEDVVKRLKAAYQADRDRIALITLDCTA